MSSELPNSQSPRPIDSHAPEGYGYGYGHQPGGYGYGYSGYYGGGGYHGAESHTTARTFQDYLVMLRERFWYLVLTVFVFFVSAMIYQFNVTPEWMAAAKVRVHRAPYYTVPDLKSSRSDDNIATNEDFLTQVELMRSLSIVGKVAQRLSQDQKRQVLEPYQDGNLFSGPLREIDVLVKCYNVRPQKSTLVAYLTYYHPNKQVATLLAGLFAEEIMQNNKEDRLNIMNPMIESMGIQIKNKEDVIKDLYKKRYDLIEEKGLLTVSARIDTARAELSDLVIAKNKDQKEYEALEALMQRLAELKKDGLPTTNLAAISSNERVLAMESEVSKFQIAISGLSQQYTDAHPRMVATKQQLEQALAERAKAIAAAEAKIEQGFYSAKANYESSKLRVDEKITQLNALNSDLSKLDILEKELRDAESLKALLTQAYESERMKAAAAAPGITLIEPAMITSTKPINQDFLYYGVGSVLVGIAVGCIIIFVLAFFDDRVKSSGDIEGYLGLPLVGILPIARKLNSFSKARVVATGEDRPVTEGFRAIYSALKINELAKNAKTFLTTSTMPSEGKSFVTTNLAMTYAMHGERVLVLDADLRMPAIGKTLQLEGDKGITRYLQGGVSLEDSIHSNVVPNMDVMAVGAPCKNPTQILNSRRLTDMISELKGRYDRIFIDSPPIGAVSDSLNLLPQVDGVIYVVRFNTVKRRFIKSNVHRLQESKVPIFGAVLNQIGLRVARYYTNTGDRAYTKYYHTESPDSVEVKV